VIPTGGQVPPISTEGVKLEWKKPQKTLKKANTSLIINKTTPMLNPFCTSIVCIPKKVASEIISLNHNMDPKLVNVNPKVNK
jgi:hypothetical protein